MKALVTIIVFSLIVTVSSVAQEPDAANKADLSKEIHDTVLDDPKLSGEERARLRLAGKDNPSVKDPKDLLDPKLSAEEVPDPKWFREHNDGKNEQVEREEVPPPVTGKPTGGKTDFVTDQPEGKKATEVTDYHSQQGLGSQPVGKKEGSVINYRELKGAQQQPDGIKPE